MGVSRKSGMVLAADIYSGFRDFAECLECLLIFQIDFFFPPFRSNLMTRTTYMEMLCSFQDLAKFAIATK